MPIAFAVIGVALICLGLLSVHYHPLLAGAVFAIGMFLAFLGIGFTVNRIRAGREQTGSSGEEERQPGKDAS